MYLTEVFDKSIYKSINKSICTNTFQIYFQVLLLFNVSPFQNWNSSQDTRNFKLSSQLLFSDRWSLTHFSPVSHFYTPWKRQKTFGFLTFSGGIEMWHWTKIGQLCKIHRNTGFNLTLQCRRNTEIYGIGLNKKLVNVLKVVRHRNGYSC